MDASLVPSVDSGFTTILGLFRVINASIASTHQLLNQGKGTCNSIESINVDDEIILSCERDIAGKVKVI